MNDEIKELPVRDLEAAIQTVGGSAELAQQLFAAFLEGLGPHLQEIRQRHRAGDWPELGASAHQLHGAAAYCGIPAMKAAIRKLEEVTKEGDPAKIDRRMEALERECERLFAMAAVQE